MERNINEHKFAYRNPNGTHDVDIYTFNPVTDTWEITGRISEVSPEVMKDMPEGKSESTLGAAIVSGLRLFFKYT